MKSQRIDVGAIRREQIVEAAVSVITEQGLQNLSLSEIEKKAGMSRGQLTYYFPAKEDILLAVFDRLVQLMYARIGTPADATGDRAYEESGWEWVQHLLDKLVTQPPISPEFGCLQYTFLSQIGHRDDFRRRLARLYEEWRDNMARGLADDLNGKTPASPRALATLVQAILHGLAMQRAADPSAFDGEEMVELCLDMLGNYLRLPARARKTNRKSTNKRSTPANGAHPALAGRAAPRGKS